MKKGILLVVILLLFLSFSLGVTPEVQPPDKVQAIRTEEPIKIDGLLEEMVWNGGGVSRFIQNDPNDGSEPTEKTTAWVAYDDNALYVAAFLYDSEPDKIVGRLERRDSYGDSDWFVFAVDPYFDRQTGFQFAVNPSGSIVDWTLYNDTWRDTTWDGVWEWASKVNEKGWTAEIRIPYHQLRFTK